MFVCLFCFVLFYFVLFFVLFFVWFFVWLFFVVVVVFFFFVCLLSTVRYRVMCLYMRMGAIRQRWYRILRREKKWTSKNFVLDCTRWNSQTCEVNLPLRAVVLGGARYSANKQSCFSHLLHLQEKRKEKENENNNDNNNNKKEKR